MTASFAGKTALVTGAGSGEHRCPSFLPYAANTQCKTGINLAFARLLLLSGCNVVFADLKLRPEARDLVATHQESGRARAVFQKTDVSSWEELSTAYETAKGLSGRLDIVCPGAGVFEPRWSNFWNPPGRKQCSNVDDASSSRYKSLDINLIHPIRLTQLAIMDQVKELKASMRPDALPSKRTVIHVSSVNGQLTPLWTPLYNAAKHALNGFVRTMAPLEARMGIRVVAVAPGLVQTPLWASDPDKSSPLSKNPAWITADEVAQVMLEMVEKTEVGKLIRKDMNTSDEARESVAVKGGSILEVSGSQVRDVAAFLDPGPYGISPDDFDMDRMEESVFRTLE